MSVSRERLVHLVLPCHHLFRSGRPSFNDFFVAIDNHLSVENLQEQLLFFGLAHRVVAQQFCNSTEPGQNNRITRITTHRSKKLQRQAFWIRQRKEDP